MNRFVSAKQSILQTKVNLNKKRTKKQKQNLKKNTLVIICSICSSMVMSMIGKGRFA